MHEHNLRTFSGGRPRSGRILVGRAGFGAAGIGLLLGGDAAYLLERGSSEALATTSTALLTTGLTGLVLMVAVVAVVAIRLLARRHAQGDRPPGQRIPIQPMGNLAAELFLVRDAGQLRPVPVRETGAHTHERRRSA
jgi:hypothetical protein